MAPRRRLNHTPRGGNSELAAVSDELRVRLAERVFLGSNVSVTERCASVARVATCADDTATPTCSTTTSTNHQATHNRLCQGAVERLSKGKTALRSTLLRGAPWD